MQPVIHHHFRFSLSIKNNPIQCKHITFHSIPFFKLYDEKSFEIIKSTIFALKTELPINKQFIIDESRPPNHVEHARHKEDLVSLTYCTLNRQAFCVRVYQLRHNNFIKVELTVHSGTLGKGKKYTFNKALRTANSFFNLLDNRFQQLPFGLHRKDYFHPNDFKELLSVHEYNHEALRVMPTGIQRSRSIDNFIRGLKDFEKDAKKAALIRLNQLEEVALCKEEFANLSVSR